MGPREVVVKFKEELKGFSETKDVEEMDEYFGCKIDLNKIEQSMKMTQPVKM